MSSSLSISHSEEVSNRARSSRLQPHRASPQFLRETSRYEKSILWATSNASDYYSYVARITSIGSIDRECSTLSANSTAFFGNRNWSYKGQSWLSAKWIKWNPSLAHYGRHMNQRCRLSLSLNRNLITTELAQETASTSLQNMHLPQNCT